MSGGNVALVKAGAYENQILKDSLELILTSLQFKIANLDRVLLKPNWVATKNAKLSCTHPLFIKAVCEYFLDHGAKVSVGDSPAFGSARSVAKASGVIKALEGLQAPIVSFTPGPRLELSFGKSVRLAREPSEADLIVNLPKLKAHSQMRVTAGVKNFFGCVVGLRKALIHTRYGDVENRFESVIMEVMLAMQPSITILDAIEAMSKTGPTNGEPVWFGMMAGSENPVALDTAIFSMLDLKPGDIPLWKEAVKRGLPGADMKELEFPLEKIDQFKSTGFMAPKNISPMTFSPPRLIVSAVKRLWKKTA